MGLVYLFQEKLIFLPVKLSSDFKFNYSADERLIEVAPGVRLNALHFRLPDARGLVLYFHGNAGNLAEWGSVSENFLPLGYDVFVFDYRGYGKSDGVINSEAMLHADAQAIFNTVAKEYSPEKIILYGRSLGSGMAVRLAAKTSVKALVLESPFFSMAEIGRFHYPFLPVSLLLRYPLRNDLYLPAVRCPIFIMHGTADEVIPWQSGQKLARLAPAAKLLLLENGHHNNSSDFVEYHKLVKEALSEARQLNSNKIS